MKSPSTQRKLMTAGRLLLTSSSLAMLTAGAAHAQQVINDGDNVTVTSAADGETISAAAGVTSTVNGAPVVIINNDDVTLDNTGTLATTGVTQTVQVNQGTTGATINNAATGTLTADSRAVDISGQNVTLNNDGVILGTGNQRNGTVYGNAPSNNITINNNDGALIDAGEGNDGAGIALEIGNGGNPVDGEINNAGTIQGRGQAAPTGGTAGDGIRFFGPGAQPQYIYAGDITNSGTINSESTQGTVAGIRFANRVSFQGTLTNEEGGVISGAQNGLYFGNDADHTGGIVNNAGTISSDSRALNIDGIGLVINNTGSIVGTGNQRNGTVYADSTAQNFELNNLEGGVIDAGEGNQGGGFSVELASAADGGNTFDITNDGLIQGRGTAAAGSLLAGDGLRFERTRVDGALDGTTDGLFIGTITNSGTIASEGDSGTTAGIRFVNGVSFQGTLENSGTISGVQNGLYFGNPTPAGGGDFSQAIVNNSGTISSDSRALNIDGIGLTVNNSGSILGTGNQRNGTVYADSTAQGFTLNNLEVGLIDAGEGLQGAGFSVELSADGNDFAINNEGTIQGRGQAGAGAATAGDGLRFERSRVDGMLDGTTTGLFTGEITNSGLISSESAQGTAAGIRFVNGVSFQGTLTNAEGGIIEGVQNGLYFGNAVPAGGADHTGGVVDNAGIIRSDSRALNIDGKGLVVNNLATGQIVGTANQRNGTVYADGTADDFTVNNAGLIDAGEGNEGSGFGAEIGSAADGANTFDLVNTGTIQGRGNAAAGTNGAGDGVRIGNVGNIGVFDGTITNSGLIDSEGANGTVAGIRFVNGISFQGTLTNEADGVISGVQNGLYFGNPVAGEGADHTGGIVNNFGTISSGSRALNIDGIGLVINNSGTILGTGNQRNGTVYADGTANNFTLNNSGVIDAVVGGSGVSLQLGTTDGDVRSFTLVNDGTIAGRGEALASGASAGLRLFNGAGADTTVTADQNIVNNGTITAETGAAVSIENVALTGTFFNNGTIAGPVAVDASSTLSALNFVQSNGALSGNFVGSAFADSLLITGDAFSLTNDVLGGVAVTVDAPTSVTVLGSRAIDGSLTANGTLNFDLGVDTLAVDGDTVLGAGSVVNIATTQVDGSAIGSTIDVLTETGTFTDNGTTVNVIDDDFLIDYFVNLGTISVTVAAADLGAVSSDANISAFGGALTTAIANNRLPSDVFAALNSSASTSEFEATSLALLPAINDGVTREIYEAQRLASSQVQDRLAGESTGLWGEVFYRNADADASSQSSLGYDADATGFTLGLDGQLSETAKVGVLFNYSDIEVEANGPANAESEIDAIQIGAYAGFDLGQAYLNAELGYSTSSVDNNRTAIGSQITGESDVDGVYASLNAGYDIDAGNVVITPNGGFRYADLSRDTFTETGGLGLTLDSDSAEFFEARIGLKVAGSVESGVIPFASVDYAYDLSSDPLGVNASFNGGTDSFRVVADEAGASRFDVAAGLDFVSGGNLTVGAEYRGRFASRYQAHSGGVRIRFAF